MEKTPIRRFSMPFDEVIEKAQLMQPQYAADLDKFITFNPWFTSEVNSTLIEQIGLGISDFSANGHTAQIEIQTKNIAQLLTSAGQKYQRLMYFVENGLGSSKAIGDTFGRQRYEKARQAEKEMVSLLNQAVVAANQDGFSQKLTTAGMPESLLAEIQTLATDLATADGIQEMLKKQQLLVTSERIELFNSMWDTMSRVSSAAKIIFENDPARLAIYQLYDAGASDSPKPPTPQA